MNSKRLSHIWLLVFTILLGGNILARAQPTNSATTIDCLLLTVEGKVEILPIGKAEWILGRTNQVLQVGDRVRTSARSRATIRLSNLSVLRVNELTRLQIQAPPGAGKQPGVNLQSGATYFFHRDKPEEMQFRTPLASGAIRGTEFHLAVADDGRTTLAMLDGQVDLTNELGRITLSSGEQGNVEPGRPPSKTAVLDALNLIQWALYYPGVVDVDELGLGEAEKQALSESVAAYRTGDLLGALKSYPENRQPTSEGERIYRAALLLSVGQVGQVEALLKLGDTSSALADALREVIAAVKFQTWNRAAPAVLATEWMAESYYLQSRSKLDGALKAARAATDKSPQFGFAWVRVAELEFSFGRTPQALEALDQGLKLSPRNAQAFALKGFLASAQNEIDDALTNFDQAIALDGALGNAWLGRGLCLIHKGEAGKGREALQTAAVLEPNRAMLRSYLGKAFSNAKDYPHARQELTRSKKLDPNDPTSWLYSALLNQQQNRINDAVRDLEKSQELNDNRSVFRSKLLLDQDRAVRAANLAGIYKDAGMIDVSVREASRAVNYDYGNYSAHLFLANSYDALRDPKQINLRYETPWFSELLVANLLSPASAGALSQNVSQQEYSRLFDHDHIGVSSGTEYFSNGSWLQYGSQYGNLGNFAYALDAYYRTDGGFRANNDLEQLTLSGKFKFQITPQDSLLLQVQYYNTDFGDLAQYYNQQGDLRGVVAPSSTARFTEKQEPNIFIGYHHEWAPGSHTLFLAGRLNDTFTQADPAAFALTVGRGADSSVNAFIARNFGLDYRSELHAYSAELQQIWQVEKHTLIGGVRYQTGDLDTQAELSRRSTAFPPIYSSPASSQSFSPNLERVSAYGYYIWQVFQPLQLTAGLSYDRVTFPVNSEVAPIRGDDTDKDQVSPKVGILVTPWKNGALRGVYTRSLGGVFYDQSVRLEPTQIAGFNQAFRSIIPESVAGLVPGSKFETWGAAFDQKFDTGTYIGITGEILKSDADRTIGAFDYRGVPPAVPGSTQERLDYEEKSLA
ncbi:MAG: FecR domain-containing protein, partial [Verrucomicrobiota bacterium]